MTMQREPVGPGQESVWDYPRPPRLESTNHHIRVLVAGVTLADSHRCWRVLETSHPPVYYIPPPDIAMDYLHLTAQQSWCEWKGGAGYYTVIIGARQIVNAAWVYPNPTPAFAPIRNYVAFYASKMDECYVDDERVQAQPGDFYGGWITRAIVGPFKGAPGTRGW